MKPEIKETLIALGVLAVIGAVAVQTYYAHELSMRVARLEAQSAGLSIHRATASAESGKLPGTPPGTQPVDRDQWDPWDAMHADMGRMQAQMDRMDRTLANEFAAIARGTQGGNSPPMAGTVLGTTLDERGGDYVVKTEIPGFNGSDFKVNVEGRVLNISAKSHGQERQSADKGRLNRQERFSSTFDQELSLPGPVNASKLHSQYRDGVLTVTVPKAG